VTSGDGELPKRLRGAQIQLAQRRYFPVPARNNRTRRCTRRSGSADAKSDGRACWLIRSHVEHLWHPWKKLFSGYTTAKSTGRLQCCGTAVSILLSHHTWNLMRSERHLTAIVCRSQARADHANAMAQLPERTRTSSSHSRGRARKISSIGLRENLRASALARAIQDGFSSTASSPAFAAIRKMCRRSGVLLWVENAQITVNRKARGNPDSAA
jgi:hypothetical protein